MKPIALFFLLVVAGLLLPVRGDESRIARFDVKRVFAGYQLTKDLQQEAEASINQTGPQTDQRGRDRELRAKLDRHLAELTGAAEKAALHNPKEMRFQTEIETVTAQLRLDDARRALTGTTTDPDDGEAHAELQRQITDLEQRLRQAAAGSLERERLKLEIQIPIDRLRMNDARRAIESVEREFSMRDEARRQRSRILDEIWTMAAKLRAERGFTLLVPVNGPNEDLFRTTIVSPDCEDVTDALLVRLNGEYAAKKAR